MKRLWIAFLCLFILTGCTTTKVFVVERKELVLVDIDPSLLNDPRRVPPPEPSRYIEMSVDEREDALVRMILTQANHLDQEKVDKRRLRATIAEQKRIVDEHNAKEADRVARLKHELENNHGK
jgi:hypothetical protein